jgi:hypothetical protein
MYLNKFLKTQKPFFILFTIMILLNACSIEKRHSMFGYHIEWRNNKFLDDNKAIAQKTKPKVTKEKAKVETGLIVDTKKNAAVINQEIKSDIVKTSNEKPKLKLINKSKYITHFKIPIVKESHEITKKKLLFPIKRITKISNSFLVALISLGLGLLFFLITPPSTSSSNLFKIRLIGTVLILIGIIAVLRELLELAVKSTTKRFKKKDDPKFNQLKQKSHWE